MFGVVYCGDVVLYFMVVVFDVSCVFALCLCACFGLVVYMCCLLLIWILLCLIVLILVGGCLGYAMVYCFVV